MTNFEKVGIFMKTFGQEVKLRPSLSSNKINSLRLSLIKEELEELKDAINKKDLVEIPKNILDDIEVKTVKTVDEVIKIALTKELKPVEWMEVDVSKSKDGEKISTLTN